MDKEEWSVLIRCPHKKTFWVPIEVFLDTKVTGYGCGCPERRPDLPNLPPPETSKRAIKRAVRQARRELRQRPSFLPPI